VAGSGWEFWGLLPVVISSVHQTRQSFGGNSAFFYEKTIFLRGQTSQEGKVKVLGLGCPMSKSKARESILLAFFILLGTPSAKNSGDNSKISTWRLNLQVIQLIHKKIVVK